MPHLETPNSGHISLIFTIHVCLLHMYRRCANIKLTEVSRVVMLSFLMCYKFRQLVQRFFKQYGEIWAYLLSSQQEISKVRRKNLHILWRISKKSVSISSSPLEESMLHFYIVADGDKSFGIGSLFGTPKERRC